MKAETLDFSGVPEERGGRPSRHIPEGDYLAKVAKVEKRWKDNDKSNVPYFSWQVQVTSGPQKGATLYHITSLKPDALFNLRNLIHAATGKNVAGKSLKFNPEALLGKKIAITVEDDEYKDKMRSRVVDTRPPEELDTDDSDDEEEEVEEEEDDDEELEDVDLDEI